MRLPGINYGGRAESLGRHDVNLPARQAAATSRAIGSVEQAAGAIYADIHSRNLSRDRSAFELDMIAIDGKLNEVIKKTSEYPAAMLSAVGADMSEYGEKPAYADYEAIGPFYQASMEKALQESLEKNVTNDRQREELQREYTLNIAKGTIRAVGVQNSRHKDATFAVLNDKKEMLLEAGDAQGAKDVVREQVGLRMISPDMGRKIEESINERVEEDAYGQVMTTGDIDGMRMILTRMEMDENAYRASGGSLEPGERYAWKKRIDSQLKSQGKRDLRRARDNLNEQIAATSMGYGQNIPESAAGLVAKDDYEAEQIRRKIRIANEQGEILTITKTMSAADDQKQLAGMYEDLKTLKNSGGFTQAKAAIEAKTRAMQIKNQMLDNDQAAYIHANDPPLRTQFKELMEMPVGPEQAAARDKYISDMNSQSDFFGVSPQLFEVVPNNYTKMIAEQLYTGNIQSDQKNLSYLQEFWGDSWTSVVAEGVKNKNITGSRIIASTADADIGQDVLGASRISWDNLVTESKAMIPNTDDPAWKNEVINIMGDYTASVRGEEISGALIKEIERLARYYVVRSRASSVIEGVEMAYNGLIGRKWVFESQGFGAGEPVLRVPKELKDMDIMTRLDIIRENFNRPTDEMMDGGRVITQEEVNDALKRQGWWWTTPKGDGAYLMWPDGNPVADPNGQLIVYKWQDILDKTTLITDFTESISP